MQGPSPNSQKSIMAESHEFAKCGGPGFAQDGWEELFAGKGLAVSS